jgi:hypothetical protein
VAQDHGVFDEEIADASFDPVVHIAAADAGVIYGDEDVVWGLEGGFGLLFEGDIEGFVEDEGEVLELGLAVVEE